MADGAEFTCSRLEPRRAHPSDIVGIAPDVSGLIQQVDVRDNQRSERGQVLFSIDQDRFKLALRQAKAAVADREETLAQAQREAKRNKGLGNRCRASNWKKASRVWPAPRCGLDGSPSGGGQRAAQPRPLVIRSPVDGYVNDRAPRSQEFVSAGRPVLSVVDSNSFHIDGYFEETEAERHSHRPACRYPRDR